MDYTDLAQKFLRAMFELNKHTTQKTVDESFKGEHFVLQYLYQNNSVSLPSDISQVMKISSARVAVILNRLEEKELIVREIDTKDRRRILVNLTQKGAQVAMEDNELILSMVIKMFESLGENDAIEFVRIITRISQLSLEAVN